MNLTPVFSVTECVEALNMTLSSLGKLTIEGELSELKTSQGKWIFGTIKDQASSLGFFAPLWNIANVRSLEVGMKVELVGRANVYGRSGSLRLVAESITPAGVGALQAAFERLKLLLTNEGLFDERRKRGLPRFPKTIGLLTAAGSEAYNDFVKITAERWGGVTILFLPISVQGQQATRSVVSGLSQLQSLNPDVIVLTRGGGSLEDLAAFNTEEVTRAVYASTIPVVCAIGHEGDVSLAEMAADRRASTPSNAAQMVVPDRATITAEVNQLASQLSRIVQRQLDSNTHLANTLLLRLERAATSHTSKLEQIRQSLVSHVARTEMQLVDHNARVRMLTSRLELALSHRLETRHRQHQSLERLLVQFDTSIPIKKGYALIRDHHGTLITSINNLSKDQVIATQLLDGTIESSITKIRGT